MHMTMSEIMPVGLCLATEELFDARRYQSNFGDHCILRSKDAEMESLLMPIKREMGSSQFERKYIEGHKAVIVSNIDKIMSLVSARYGNSSIRSIESIVREGKSLMKKVLQARTFDDVMLLQPAFKTKISLPVYELFLESTRR